MKLDATDLRYVSAEEFKVLKAFEQGSKNHEVVPSALIAQISGLKYSGINKLMGLLAKRNLIARVQNAAYDGYRLTYGGYDYLAIRALSKEDAIEGVGQQIGVGKESDIYIVSGPDEERRVLKIHRLGRISFRAVKEKRDYMGKRKSASWMYLSKLAAMKEYAFMQILHEYKFPVPKPIAQSRHCIVMGLVDNAYPLRQVSELPASQIPLLYAKLMKLIVRFARAGLVHGDFNEFNLLIREVQPDSEYEVPDEEYELSFAARAAAKARELDEAVKVQPPIEPKEGERVEKGKNFERIVSVVPDASSEAKASEAQDEEESSDEEEEEEGDEDEEMITFEDGTAIEPIVIDFPQMTSVEHENAEEFFDRDVNCVRRFFRKRFRYTSDDYPSFRDVVPLNRERRRRAAADALRQRGRVLSVDNEEAQIAAVEGEGQVQEQAQEEEYDEYADDPEFGELLELDALVKASGFGAGGKLERELQEAMRKMRLGGAGGGERSDSEDDEEEDSEEEDEDDEEEEEEEEEDDDDEDDAEEEEEAEEKAPRKSRAVPSRGAAEKAAAEGDQRLIAMRVARERARKAIKAEKHHGKKAHAGKAGRAHPGGKAKGNSVKNDLAF